MFTSPSGRLLPIWSFLLAAAFSAAVFIALAYFSAIFSGYSMRRFELIFRPLLALALFGLYTWMLKVADHVEESRPAAMGLPLVTGWQRQFGAGCLLGLGLTLLAAIPLAIWANVTITVLATHGSARLAGRILSVLILLVFGAFGEEMMFRGYPFQRLEEAIGAFGAITVFSILFGAVHVANPGASPLGLFNTILIGIVLAIAYLRTRALWLPWGLHFSWNACNGLLIGLPVSGLTFCNVVVRTSATGPHWLTGGGYGLEASAPGAVVIVIAVLVIWKWPVAQLGEPLTSLRPESEHLDTVSGIQS